ncbi:hypothetical protein WA026_011140 [Henosepilachna vigintioctopunctata]|uniref:Uncharacterized protein n=1 Tax=Henosepilachna vigintioctopunctata TaxID=420089 RepID=A0AAW1U5V6_9CUCU
MYTCNKPKVQNIDKIIYFRQGNVNSREKEKANMDISEETCKTPVELYRRKINDNLKILNMKATNVIQDSLLGVENICNKVRECLKEDPSCIISNDNYMDTCGRGDIMEHAHENKIGCATYEAQKTCLPRSPNIPASEKSKKVSPNKKINIARRKGEGNSETIPVNFKNKPGTQPNSTSSSTEKKVSSNQKRELNLNSLDETEKAMEPLRKCEKRKRPMTKTKKLQPCTESQAPESKQIKNTSGGIQAKVQLGKIEKDYEKVVKSLEMVEQMMASISRKMSNSEKIPQATMEIEEKPEIGEEVNSLENEMKELPKTGESQAIYKNKPCRKKKIVDKHWVNEMIKRKKERNLKGRDCEEEKVQSSQDTQKMECSIEDSEIMQETFQKCKIMNQSPKAKISDSVTDLDTLIDNAVHELGNLVTDFDISQNSSDASFRLTTVNDAKNIYEEYLQNTSSSNVSETVPEEDVPKFKISKSFQELKESYLRENRRQIRNIGLKKKEGMSSSEERLEKNTLCNGDQIKVIGSLTSQVSWNENKSYICKNGSPDEEIINNKIKVTGADIASKLPKCKIKEEKEDIITISMPYDKNFRSCSKSKKNIPKIQTVNTEKLDDDTIQITVTLKEDAKDRKKKKIYSDYHRDKNNVEHELENDLLSENEFCECNEDFDTSGNDDTLLNEEYQMDKNEKNSTEELNFENHKENIPTNQKLLEDGENSPLSSENTTENSSTRNKLSVGTDKDLTSSESASSSQLWNEMTRFEGKLIDPMKQISLQCKKMIGDLVVEEDNICLKRLMKGFFNSELIYSTVSKYKRCRLCPLVQDPYIKEIEPIVHRKMAVPDLHDRMELQIQQTDSFHGFLNLMDKNRRKTLIKNAEKQDHNYRCQMKACFRKKYPFKVVTASVPTNCETKMRDKKDPEKKYINSLWFSPKDFKLRRNSRIFNEKRLEMYCQSLHRGPLIPKCKCKEEVSRENKRASNYNILVRSGTPLCRRPNTPTRWVHPHYLMSPRDPQRARLRHCDILDDLTLKDLAPFNAEYSSLNEKTETQRLEDSLIFKLANSEDMGDAEENLMHLITPKLSSTEMECNMCKQKLKSQRRYRKGQKPLKKSGNTTPKNDDLQTLSPKAAAQLLIQNIGEIKSKKGSPKSQASEKCLALQKDVKNKRSMKSIGKNSKKALTKDSKSYIYQKIEENLVKNILCNQTTIPIIEFAQTSLSADPSSTVKSKNSFRRVEAFHTVLKIPEFHPKSNWGNTTVNKLFPYINDPENKVFQNITVLPVKVLYENESLNDTTKNNVEHVCGDSIDNDTPCDHQETCTIDKEKYSTVDDCSAMKMKGSKKRLGTPRCTKPYHNQDSKKRISSPTRLIGISSPVSETQHSIEIPCGPNCQNDTGANRGITKITPKPRTRRSNSLGKSIEIENGDFKNSDSQLPHKRSYNPNPWKPCSRIPDPLPFAKYPIRIKSKDNKHNQMQPSKIASAGKITVKEEDSCGNCANAYNMINKLREKCVNGSKRSPTSHLSRESSQSQILVNKDKKIKFDIKPTKVFYEIDDKSNNKCQNIRASRSHSSSPSHKTMVDHLCALRSRNVKLQGSIQKAINIIEEKMVDVLSTKDRNSKKKTIERMEKEINNVLKMINEQSYKITETGGDFNSRCQEGVFTQPQKYYSNEEPELSKHLVDTPHFAPVVPNTAVYSVILQNEDRPPIDTKTPLMDSTSTKKTNTTRKRATSKLIKLQARPSTVEEEESKSTPSEDSFQISDIAEKVQNKENNSVNLPECEELKQERKLCCRYLEKYPLAITGSQASQSPLVSYPTPIPPITYENLRHKHKKQ